MFFKQQQKNADSGTEIFDQFSFLVVYIYCFETITGYWIKVLKE